MNLSCGKLLAWAVKCATHMHSLQVAIMTPGGGIWGYLYTKTNQRSKCCALCRFHMTDGQNACYQITNDRRSKCAWPNCVLHIPFILSGSPMYAGYIHATHAWLKTGRLGLQRQEEPTIKISPLQITYPAQERLQAKLMAVSYTHLTLPTSDLV